MRRVVLVMLTLAGMATATAAGVLLYVGTADLAPLIQSHGPRLFGRPVQLGSLRVVLGWTIGVSAQDVRLPAATNPAAPDLAKAAKVEAVLDLGPLLRGSVVVRSLAIDDLSVTLTRDREGIGNWATARSAAHDDTPDTLPPLLDVAVRHSDVVYIGSSGKPFRIHLDRALIHAIGTADPVTLDWTGSLQDVPVALQGTVQSFEALRDRATPFGMKLLLTSGRSRLTYDGTATDPLAFDGLDGAAELTIPDLGELLASMHQTMQAALPVNLAGHLTASHGDWLLREARGTLDQAPFTGKVHMVEGKRGEPDMLAPSLDFITLDLGRVMGKFGSGGGSIELPVIEAKPDPLLDAHLSARHLAYLRYHLTEVALDLVLEPGRAAVEQVQAGVAGGRVSGSAVAVPALGETQVVGSASAQGVDLRQAFQLAGKSAPPATGPASGIALVDITGHTLAAALGRGRVTAAVAMTGGSVARNLMRQVSLDISSLWREDSAFGPLNCLLAVVDLHNGAGKVGPVRAVTPDGAVDGWGEMDLNRSTIAVTLQSDGRTTGSLALDIPIRITGPLANLSIAPSIEASRHRFGPSFLGPWPAEVDGFIRRSPCFRR